MDNFCKSMSLLASCEDNTSLARAFSQLAETQEKVGLLQNDQAEKDFFIFSEMLQRLFGPDSGGQGLCVVFAFFGAIDFLTTQSIALIPDWLGLRFRVRYIRNPVYPNTRLCTRTKHTASCFCAGLKFSVRYVRKFRYDRVRYKSN